MFDSKIRLAHGSGGSLAQQLIESVFLKYFNHSAAGSLEDAAVLPWKADHLVYTTDSFVISPIFFPGGDIGRLSVCGTVNDLSMMGAEPLYLTAGFIIEEGFSVDSLIKVVQSMKKTAEEAEVEIVAGDTKVVPKGQMDGLFINTSGVGRTQYKMISAGNAQAGDCIFVSGSLGRHGLSVAMSRSDLGFENVIESDVAPVNCLVKPILHQGIRVHSMRDPTRGGLATVLNEIAQQSDVGIEINETDVPVEEAVHAACSLLGFEPLYLSNEGIFTACIHPDDAVAVIHLSRKHRYGKLCRIIGKVVPDHPKKVVLNTQIGGQRILPMLSGEQLPRIC